MVIKILPVCGNANNATSAANVNGNYWSQEAGYLNFNANTTVAASTKTLNTTDNTNGLSVRCVQK